MKQKPSPEPEKSSSTEFSYPLPELESFFVLEGRNEYEGLKQRTKQFALRIIKLARAMPSKDPVSEVIQKQILRSGTSVGANYRAACRAKSTPDFINKMKIVEEETDESMFWMELIQEAEILPASRISSLYQESDEILRIVVQSILTARKGS